MKSFLNRRSLLTGFALVVGINAIGASSALAASSHDISWEQLDGQHRLPDGDYIQVSELPGGAPSDKIEVQLILSGLSWWKGIQSNEIVLCQAQDSQTYSSAQISLDQVNSRGLQLWKAKTFGAHHNMYNIHGVQDHLRGGNSYVFTWFRD
ncbi:MAG TPA: hypothetical protein VE954_41205 [Oligoflexus sp.]|uniref:hypothetical protein n=1 Tax=Oligoflexus sp. TaxID=1971216 RepID=UPI002D63EBA5|nr:hypothetical protein [Oligoflexus sp.]HYX39561.1 hypothetical protein [Oligoflexus sp.]